MNKQNVRTVKYFCCTFIFAAVYVLEAKSSNMAVTVSITSAFYVSVCVSVFALGGILEDVCVCGYQDSLYDCTQTSAH